METSKREGTYNAFERFMYLFFIPFVFTAILISVLLSMFGYNVLDPLQRFANQVPGLNKIVPDPVESSDVDSSQLSSNDMEVDADVQVSELEEQLTGMNQQLLAAQTEISQKDAEIESLTALNEELQQQLEEKTLSDEEYLQRIQNLANTYAEMSASKAAPIMEQLTLEERVLVLGQMDQEAQVDIMEKMDPVIAAETSILLKDTVSVKDQEIAALQSRLNLQAEDDGNANVLTSDELSLTIAGMSTENASALLLEMQKSSESEVIQILRGMNQDDRSAIMDALTSQSPENAARLASQLDG